MSWPARSASGPVLPPAGHPAVDQPRVACGCSPPDRARAARRRRAGSPRAGRRRGRRAAGTTSTPSGCLRSTTIERLPRCSRSSVGIGGPGRPARAARPGRRRRRGRPAASPRTAPGRCPPVRRRASPSQRSGHAVLLLLLGDPVATQSTGRAPPSTPAAVDLLAGRAPASDSTVPPRRGVHGVLHLHRLEDEDEITRRHRVPAATATRATVPGIGASSEPGGTAADRVREAGDGSQRNRPERRIDVDVLLVPGSTAVHREAVPHAADLEHDLVGAMAGTSGHAVEALGDEPAAGPAGQPTSTERLAVAPAVGRTAGAADAHVAPAAAERRPRCRPTAGRAAGAADRADSVDRPSPTAASSTSGRAELAEIGAVQQAGVGACRPRISGERSSRTSRSRLVPTPCDPGPGQRGRRGAAAPPPGSAPTRSPWPASRRSAPRRPSPASTPESSRSSPVAAARRIPPGARNALVDPGDVEAVQRCRSAVASRSAGPRRTAGPRRRSRAGPAARAAAPLPSATAICCATRSTPNTHSVTGCSTCSRVFISRKKNRPRLPVRGAEQELDGAGADVADGGGGGPGRLAEPGAQRRRRPPGTASPRSPSGAAAAASTPARRGPRSSPCWSASTCTSMCLACSSSGSQNTVGVAEGRAGLGRGPSAARPPCSARRCTARMPRPPPPADAFTSSGKSASVTSAGVEVGQHRHAGRGHPLPSPPTFEPIAAMTSGGGPTQVSPASSDRARRSRRSRTGSRSPGARRRRRPRAPPPPAASIRR